MIDIREMTDEQVAQQIARELRRAPSVAVELRGNDILTLIALLQLAYRHPNVDEGSRQFVRLTLDALRKIGPTLSALISQGYQPCFDRKP